MAEAEAKSSLIWTIVVGVILAVAGGLVGSMISLFEPRGVAVATRVTERVDRIEGKIEEMQPEVRAEIAGLRRDLETLRKDHDALRDVLRQAVMDGKLSDRRDERDQRAEDEPGRKIVPVLVGTGTGTGWTWRGPLAALWRLIRGG